MKHVLAIMLLCLSTSVGSASAEDPRDGRIRELEDQVKAQQRKIEALDAERLAYKAELRKWKAWMARRPSNQSDSATRAATSRPAKRYVPRSRGWERTADLTLRKMPFVKAIEEIRGVAELPLMVRWREIEAAGVPRDKPVSLVVTNTCAMDALKLLLAAAGQEKVTLDMAFIGRTLTVSTREDIDRQSMKLLRYDLRSMVSPRITGAQIRQIEWSIRGRIDPTGWKKTGRSMRTQGTTLELAAPARIHLAVQKLLQSYKERYADKP